MLQDQPLQLKAQIENEETLFCIALETNPESGNRNQRFENLKAIRRRISALNQQLFKLESNPPIEQLPSTW